MKGDWLVVQSIIILFMTSLKKIVGFIYRKIWCFWSFWVCLGMYARNHFSKLKRLEFCAKLLGPCHSAFTGFGIFWSRQSVGISLLLLFWHLIVLPFGLSCWFRCQLWFETSLIKRCHLDMFNLTKALLPSLFVGCPRLHPVFSAGLLCKSWKLLVNQLAGPS